MKSLNTQGSAVLSTSPLGKLTAMGNAGVHFVGNKKSCVSELNVADAANLTLGGSAILLIDTSFNWGQTNGHIYSDKGILISNA